jgi:hypothetical protein
MKAGETQLEPVSENYGQNHHSVVPLMHNATGWRGTSYVPFGKRSCLAASVPKYCILSKHIASVAKVAESSAV